MTNSKVKSQKSKVAELEQNWKRALADYQNLVKRFETEKQEVVKLASLNVVSKLLPTLDVLELAAGHSQDEGVSMAVKQFQRVLADEGLQEIAPAVGDKFDPSIHECIERINSEPADLPAGRQDSIAELVFKGYKINGFTLRPAKVKVFST